ncbi:hypothetical protein JOL79_20785 [Microbispora sp. RL4-1S]|uniref:Uncharacterized protein n=1 Tax=Microbispora oryzae TaxID=2806554 RepID=A0A940WIK5_9ACTN|nr:hypothetical protein [Microbispora oryzae]MBP2706250.1 hypothetical protein [Microbispora oryzae]
MIRTYPRPSAAQSQTSLNPPASSAAFTAAVACVRTALGEADAGDAQRIVNVVGPLGVGKSHLLTTLSARFVDLGRASAGAQGAGSDTAPGGVSGEVPGGAPLAVDGVDTDDRADAAARFLDRAGRGRFLIASRLPLISRAGWAHRPLVTVELRPWSPADIRELASSLGVADPARIDLVVRLSGGIPLVAGSLCRAILRGGEPGPVGALADLVATEVLHRLATESPAVDPEAVPIVSTVDGVDEDLLTALARLPPATFTLLRRLSVIRPDHHGLRVAEPYRTLFDLAYRWRHPVLRDEIAARGAAHRHRQLSRTADPALRARLADQVLYLSGRGRARRDLYAEAGGEFSVRRAHDGDGDAIARLIRLWAAAEGLADRTAEAMRDLWLSGADHGFHLVVDTDDHPVGMTNLTPLDPHGSPALESLLQQHAGTLLEAGTTGSVVGMMAVEPRFARAQPALVRHILTTAIASGRLVVSTPWVPYQQMSARFGLSHLGDARHDLYRCGRPSALYTRTFTPEELPAWLRRMQGPRPEGPYRMVELVRAALRDLNSPARLAASPLQALAGPGPAPPLGDLLRQAVVALGSSDSAVDAEAGQVLSLYYLARAGGHDLLAHRLHLSRATYFRRLDHGVAKVAETVIRSLGLPGPPTECR